MKKVTFIVTLFLLSLGSGLSAQKHFQSDERFGGALNLGLGTGGIRALFDATGTYPYHVMTNNVISNNTNDPNTGVSAISNVNSDIYSTTGLFLLASNIANGGCTNLLAAPGNLTDLASTNTGTNAPYFKNPTTLIGANRIPLSADSIAIAQSRWNIDATSYLKGKGFANSNTRLDKAGNAYANPPSVGAYEYNLNSYIQPVISTDLVLVQGRNIRLTGTGVVEVYNAIGQTIARLGANENSLTLKNGGIYIVKQQSSEGVKTQKILVK